MAADTQARFLDWDTRFFGVRVASLQARALGHGQMERELEWCRTNAIECVYLLADAGDLETLRTAQERGFRLVDIRVTFEARLDRELPRARAGDPSRVRLARPEDVPSLRAIAAVSHTDSRFYADPRFDRERCSELYATWIERSCNGWADVVFVAELEREPVGYLSCHRRPDGRGDIGLVGVAARAANQGLGSALVARALTWFREQGLARATVVTQARNVGAQRLYQSAGFQTASVALWHHLWFEDARTARP